jgi:hypothetical protein
MREKYRHIFLRLDFKIFLSIVLFNTNDILFLISLVQEWLDFFCDLCFTEMLNLPIMQLHRLGIIQKYCKLIIITSGLFSISA